MGMDTADRLALLPPIRRARGYRLYAEDGRRFLDCWQEGGGCILGHRPAALSPRLTDDISKGLTASVPSRAQERLERLTPRLFPGYAYAVAFADEMEARLSLGSREAIVPDWRPFLPVPEAETLIVKPPLPVAFRPTLVLRSPSCDLPRPRRPLPLAGFAAAAALRALQALRREEEGKALEARQKGWALFDRFAGHLFTREGPWLLPRAYERYDDIFTACLSKGILLSPRADRPSLVPAEFNEGEIAFLKEYRP